MKTSIKDNSKIKDDLRNKVELILDTTPFYKEFKKNLLQFRDHKHDPIFKLTSSLSRDPIIIAILLRVNQSRVELDDGYVMHILEYIVEQDDTFMKDIMKAFSFKDYDGDSFLSMDFFG